MVHFGKVRVFAQCHAAIADRMEGMDRLTALDCGSWTLDIMSVVNKVPVLDECHTYQQGLITAIDRIQKECVAKYGKEVPEYIINEVIETEAVKWAILCFVRGEIRFREEMSTMELMQEFVRDFAKQSKADNEQIMQDAVTRILATIISAMGQQMGGYVAAPAMMQMQGMNVMPAPPVTPAEPTEPVKEMVEELQDNNLELSDKPLG